MSLRLGGFNLNFKFAPTASERQEVVFSYGVSALFFLAGTFITLPTALFPSTVGALGPRYLPRTVFPTPPPRRS